MSFTTAITRLSYNGDGVSVNFPVPWLFYANTDLLVIMGGVTQGLGAQFNATGAGLGSGTVTFVTAPPVGAGNVQIILNDPLTQVANFVDGTAFPSATLNQVNDRAVQISSRLYDLITRSLRAPDGDASPNMLLPPALIRANKGMVFDASGNPGLGVIPTVTFTQAIWDAFLAGTTHLPSNAVNVFLYGARGDGSADDTVAIQSAINAAQILCATVYIPATTASYKLTSPLNITAGLRIIGDGFSPYTPSDFGTRGPGSWLQFAHLGKGFNIDNAAADVTSVFLEKFGTFRNQAAPGLGWAPLATDFDIYIGDADVHIRDVMLWNPSYGVQINSSNGARITIDGLFGQPLIKGIHIVLAEDVVRIENVHFWPWWENDNTYINAYTRLNLVALQMERCDNPFISDFFCIFSYNGIVFSSNVNGFTQRAELSNIGIDTYTANAITILAGADGTSFIVNGLYGFAGSGVCTGISCYADNCLLQASSVRFSQMGFCGSTIAGSGNIAKYTNWIVDGYNFANNGSNCIFTLAGNQTIISDKITATATHAAPLLNNASVNNYGAVAAQGTWSMVNPATSVVITHGLGWAPLGYQILLQFNSAPGSAYYIDTITLTQFTIHGAPPGTTNGTWTIDGRTP